MSLVNLKIKNICVLTIFDFIKCISDGNIYLQSGNYMYLDFLSMCIYDSSMELKIALCYHVFVFLIKKK